MTNRKIYHTLSFLIAAVWFVNGFICKVLNLVPRHQEIVASILGLGGDYAAILTIAIGLAEIGMAIWIMSGIKSRFCAMAQIIIVAMMNILEFILVPDLLLWGRLNVIFALMFILVVYYNEFVLTKSVARQT